MGPALGTVKSIGVHCIHVMLDHNPAKECHIKRVRSKFQVIQKCFVYRKQFPLILAFAVTIHKCQGMSLDCAIIDHSSDVFATGMAYVALSRVRTLEGLHLVAFDLKSIKVNFECIEEVNRLRKTLTRDLPYLKIPDKQTAHNHKITASLSVVDPSRIVPLQPSKRASELKKPPTKKRKLNDSSCKNKTKHYQFSQAVLYPHCSHPNV